MNYAEATRYLISLGNEIRASSLDSAQAAKLGLENITELLEDLGRPQDTYPSVLISGTNGKGSVAVMLDAVLREAGLRTGLYTSPHLIEINERIQSLGKAIPPDEFAALFTALQARIERLLAEGRLRFHPTYFECLTAMGFEYFRRERCEIAVLEVGMGGRLDATNTAMPRVAVITQVDFDHERFLGTTVRAIAAEKAGIIKRGGVAVSAASHPEAAAVIRAKAEAEGARLVETWREYSAEDLLNTGTNAGANAVGRYSFQVTHSDGFRQRVEPALRGKHQVENALAAVAAARELARQGFPIMDEHIRQGLAAARWPGRLEVFREEPLVLLDGAHNPAGARALARFWDECLAGRRVVLVYGAMSDKAVPEITEILFPKAAAVVLTRPEQFRAATPETVRELAGHLNANIMIEPEPEAALARALAEASPRDVIVVTGSLFLVGDIKKRWAQEAESQEPAAVAGSTIR